MNWVARRNVSNLLWGEHHCYLGRNLVSTREISVPYDEPTSTEDNWRTTELLRIRSRFYGQFPIYSDPGRHFLIDTSFALALVDPCPILARGWSPWLFAYWRRKRVRIYSNSFSPLVSPTFLLFKSTRLLISLFCCAGVDIIVYSAHSHGISSFTPL